MTYILETELEELRAEMNACIDAADRRQIATELELVQAELAVIMAEQNGAVDVEPPF